MRGRLPQQRPADFPPALRASVIDITQTRRQRGNMNGDRELHVHLFESLLPEAARTPRRAVSFGGSGALSRARLQEPTIAESPGRGAGAWPPRAASTRSAIRWPVKPTSS